MGCGLVRGKARCLLVIVCLAGMHASADSKYFPPRTFVVDPPSGLQDISKDLSDWYSKALSTMKEPSLWELARQGQTMEVYRLLWLPTWGRPVAVRVEKAGGRMTLNEVQLDGDGGYELGEVAVRKQTSLSQRDWDRLMERVEEAAFWGMPTSINDLGVDGEHLIVEGVRDGRFHVVDRWSPRPGAYRELCRSMLSFAGLPLGGRTWRAPESSSVRWAWPIVILGVLLSASFLGAVLIRKQWWRSQQHPPPLP
jgi:hypothetical protein